MSKFTTKTSQAAIFSLYAAWVIFTTIFNQNEPQMCSLGKQFVNLEIFWIEKSVFSKWQVIKSLKKTYNDTLSFTKPTESQLNTIIIQKIKWFNNNICPSGSLIIQFKQRKIQQQTNSSKNWSNLWQNVSWKCHKVSLMLHQHMTQYNHTAILVKFLKMNEIT